MADLQKFFSKFQLVKKRGKKLTVVMLVVAILLSMGALAALQFSLASLKNRSEKLRDQAIYLEGENAQLQEDIDEVGSIQSIVEIAEKELGLGQPDAVFYQPES